MIVGSVCDGECWPILLLVPRAHFILLFFFIEADATNDSIHLIIVQVVLLVKRLGQASMFDTLAYQQSLHSFKRFIEDFLDRVVYFRIVFFRRLLEIC